MGVLSRMLRLPWTFFLVLPLSGLIASALHFSPDSRYSNGTDCFYPLTLVVSLDGFHPAYISRYHTPRLHALLSGDHSVSVVSTPYMIPSFPSQTFPNHWTLVTGLYPTEHGVVGNTFWDPLLQSQFSTGVSQSTLDSRYWGGDSLWYTAQSAYAKNVKNQQTPAPFKVATHMWPGSEAIYDSLQDPSGFRTPHYYVNYNGNETLDTKIKSIFEYIDMPFDDRPRLIMNYIPHADTFGHQHGIPSDRSSRIYHEFTSLLSQIDTFFTDLFTGLEQRNLTELTNVVIMSDHGMSNVDLSEDSGKYVFWEDLLDYEHRKLIENISGFPMYGIRVRKSDEDFAMLYEIYFLLQESIQKHSPHFKVYLTEDLPREWRFGSDRRFSYRVAPLWIVSEPGYYVTTKEEYAQRTNTTKLIGVHGYNNTDVDMRALFLGTGPYFEQFAGKDPSSNTSYLQPFENIQVYQILCDMVGVLKPGANNGTFPYPLSELTDEQFKEIKLPDGWSDNSQYLKTKFPDSTYNLLWNHLADDTGMSSTTAKQELDRETITLTPVTRSSVIHK